MQVLSFREMCSNWGGGNFTLQGGAIYAVNDANVEIHACTFERNQASYYVSAFLKMNLIQKSFLDLSSNWGGGTSTL